MDPICEKKYNFLQKYVPFLANLIKLLANDSEKQGKLAQMQLLYDLLNKPDNSVKIETLEKCEEVLCRVFGNNDEKIAEGEWVMPSPFIKSELLEEPEDGLERSDDKSWENLNGSIEHQCDTEITNMLFGASTNKNPTEKVIEELSQLDNSEGESSKLANVHKSSHQEDASSKQDSTEEKQIEDVLANKSHSASAEQTNSEDENKNDLNIEDEGINEDVSKDEVKPENETKLNNEKNFEDEIENDEKILEKQNDLEATKKTEPDTVGLESDTQINKTELELQNEATKKIESEEEDKTIDKAIITSIPEVNKIEDIDENAKSDEDEKKNEIKKGDDNEKYLSQKDSEPSSACVEKNQSVIVGKNEEVSRQISEKETLLIANVEKSANPLNKISTSDLNEFDSSCSGEKTSGTGEGVSKVKENSKPQEQETVKEKIVDVEINNSVEQAEEKETTKTEDQCEDQTKSDKLEDIEKISEKSEDIKKTDNGDDLLEEKKNTDDVINQSASEMLRFKIVSAESLASPEKTTENTKHDEKTTDSSEMESNNTAKETKTSSETDNNDPLDPLNHSPEKLSETNIAKENGSISPKPTNKDEDDDDVLLVENRSSPICIDSDPEDEENMKGNRSLPIIPPKLPTPKQKPVLPKPKVRKSTTAVMETIRQIINKNQNITPKKKNPIQQKPKTFRDNVAFVKKDAKALMETIDLLDSDSGDERPNNNSKKPKNNSTNIDDDVILVSSTPQPSRKLLTKKLNQTVPAPKHIPRHYSKLANKSPAKPATAQSNFLNAVNLQPAKSNSSNPASFSARLSNKKVIIPNAFYGNPSYNRKSSLSSFSSIPSRVSSSRKPEELPSSKESPVAPPTRAVGVYSGVSIRHVQDKVLKEWLDGFLTNFASPLQIASHACFVLLQRVLKYRFFQRLKETRIFLNTAAKNCSAESVDVQMLLDLRNVFLENDYLTEAGRRFCRFATNDAFGKPVALTTDSKTGRVTCRTRVASKGDLPTDIARIPNSSFIRNPKPITPDKAPASTVQSQGVTPTTAAAFNSKSFINSTKISPVSNTSTPSSVPKRRGKFRKLSDGLVVAEKDEDDNDYTPAHDELEPEAEIVTERKKSLRTNRTKRKEAGFTYSEDHDDEEFEAIARKIENKKREEQRLAEERELEMERELLEQQRKTNKKTVAKKTTSKRNGGQIDNPKGPTRKKLRLANTSIVGSEDNDLLTPTWIEADGEDGEVDSLLDFADDPQSPDMRTNSYFESNNAPANSYQNDEIIEESSLDSSDTFDMHTDKTLKNIDSKLHLHSKTYDLCVHCQRKVPRIVHHYVNEHRSSEVFPSRLRNRDIRRLLTTSNVGFVHLYKGNQIQYAAHCIFCDKEAKFLLPYWFEHFTMHTGEYSFKCSGCHILKPTRSLLTNHITSNTGCPKKGTAIRLVNFDTKVHQIEAHICSICNYIQIHRKNLQRHLRTQHGLDTISPDQIIKVVLLQISAPSQDQDTVQNDESQLALLQHSDDEDVSVVTNAAPLDENSLMMQHDFTDNDDLSFMICGMLDVQTNLSPTG